MRHYRTKPKTVEAGQLGSGDYVVVDGNTPRVVAQDAFEDAFEPCDVPGFEFCSGGPLIPAGEAPVCGRIYPAAEARALGGVTKIPQPESTHADEVARQLTGKVDPRILESARQEALPPVAKNLRQSVAKLPPGKGKGQPRRQPKEGIYGRYCTKCHQKSGGPRSIRCAHCMEKF